MLSISAVVPSLAANGTRSCPLEATGSRVSASRSREIGQRKTRGLDDVGAGGECGAKLFAGHKLRCTFLHRAVKGRRQAPLFGRRISLREHTASPSRSRFVLEPITLT